VGNRVGIIAGTGLFPYLVAKELKNQGKELFVLAVEAEVNPDLASLAERYETVSAGEVARIIHFFQANKIKQALLTGKVSPEWLLKVEKLDSLARELLSHLPARDASSVIESFIRLLRRQGIEVLDPTPFFQPFLCSPGFLTPNVPTAETLADVELAFSLAGKLADLEIGQVVAVKKRVVVAVEALEGTDKMIERAAAMAGPGFSVVKVGRSQQKTAVDLPAIGPETVRRLVAGKASCLGLEAGRVAFFGREEALKIAAEAGLAVLVRERNKGEEGGDG